MLEFKIKPVTRHLATWLDTALKIVQWFDLVSFQRSEAGIVSFLCSMCDVPILSISVKLSFSKTGCLVKETFWLRDMLHCKCFKSFLVAIRWKLQTQFSLLFWIQIKNTKTAVLSFKSTNQLFDIWNFAIQISSVTWPAIWLQLTSLTQPRYETSDKRQGISKLWCNISYVYSKIFPCGQQCYWHISVKWKWQVLRIQSYKIKLHCLVFQ